MILGMQKPERERSDSFAIYSVMPTIEIVSIDAASLKLNQANFEIAITEESKLVSHRGLFYHFLLKQKGVIVHIGNPDQKEDGALFGGMLINWDFEQGDIIIPEYENGDLLLDIGANQQFKFQFKVEYKKEIDCLLKIALEESPIKKVYFLTDYQFGPEEGKTELIYTVTDFWEQHETEGLNFNTLYELYGL